MASKWNIHAVEADRQKVQFDTMKRKLDNTSKELKTAQAMIETLKDQNHEKANRIAKWVICKSTISRISFKCSQIELS